MVEVYHSPARIANDYWVVPSFYSGPGYGLLGMECFVNIDIGGG
jgi:hypothetical protein